MRRSFGLWSVSLLLMGASNLPLLAGEPYLTYRTEARFEDVMENLRMAIQERGLYINNEMHMADMLDRTGKDLGYAEQVYLKAESIEFCSAVLSRKMFDEDPRRVVNCPFIVSVYVVPSEPKTTFLVHRNLLSMEDSPALREVAEMLKGVAEAAAAW